MIKIGIFSRNIDNLSNFEYRFYDWCKQQDWLEISVIFFVISNKLLCLRFSRRGVLFLVDRYSTRREWSSHQCHRGAFECGTI